MGAAGIPIGELVSLGWAISGISVDLEALTIWVPWLNVIEIAFDLLELAGIIPDPLQELLSLFAGRPKETATIQQAQRLLTARNPAARAFGIALQRLVKQFDITTSTGGSGRAILDVFTQQFVDNLTAQGITSARAFQILENALSRAAQSGLELEPELQTQLDQQLGFNGKPQTSQDLITQYNKAIASGKNCKQALNAAEAWVWKNEPLYLIGQMRIGHFIPQMPPTDPVLPGPDCTCPQGYTLDPTTELCHPTIAQQPGPSPTPTPGPTPSPIPQIPWPQPDPNGDEITNDLCAQLGGYFSNLIYAMCAMNTAPAPSSGGAGGSGGTSTDCCDQIAASMANIITALGTIAGNISSSGATVDVSSIVTALDSLTTAVSTIAAAPAADLAPVTAALTDIKNAIAANPTDLSQVVAQLKAIFTTLDVPMTTYEWMAQQGYISSGLLQQLGTGELGSGIVAAFQDFLHQIWSFLVGAALGGEVSSPDETLASFTGTIAESVDASTTAMLNLGAAPMYGVIKGLVDAVTKILTPATPPPLGESGVDPDVILAKTLAPALIVNGVTLLFSYFGWELSEGLSEYVDKASEFLGLAEIAELKVGQLLKYGPLRYAEMQARMLNRQELPGASALAGWHARGLIPDTGLTTFYAWNGLPEVFESATTNSAYHGWSPRQLIRAIETGMFTDTDVADELTFSGMRTTSQHRFLLAAPYLATASYRSKLEVAIELAHQNGLMSDADFTANIDSAEQNTDRDNLLLAAQKWRILTTEAKLLEKEYSDLFIGGVTDDATYRADLATIGFQPGYIDIIAGVAEARANVILQKKNIRDAAAIAKATTAAERKTALQSFKAGTTDLVALGASLALTGLTPAQVAAQTSLAALQQSGSLRWIYGLLKTPTEAALLRERVGALTDQRKRLQIDDATYLAQLQALGIPPRVVNALNAAANSMITPKSSAVVTPIATT